MTNKEIVAQMPCGEIVPKRILAAMKRKGLIYDYSPFGYLESVSVNYKDPNDSWYYYLELFPNGNAKDADSFVGTSEELRKKFTMNGNITYHGCTFSTKYLSGCFKPYLVKTAPKTDVVVNRTMCLWGAVI